MKSAPRLYLAAIALVAILAACVQSKPASSSDNLVVGKAGDAGAIDNAPVAVGSQSEDDAAVPIGSNDPVRGNRLAAVTLVIFSDFQCPFCSRLVPTIERLAGAYGPDQLRVVFKNDPLPFHPHAKLAAEVGQAVFEMSGSEAFWRYHNLAFEKQADIGQEAIIAWGVAAGADERALRDGISSHRWTTKIDRDLQIARTHGANGTPTSFVDGIEIVGARPFDDFKELVESELAQSKALATQGVPRDQIYTRLAAVNFKASAEREAAERAKREEQDRQQAAKDAAEQKIVHKIPVGSGPVRGPATAEVTIIEFSDFQCPYCKRVEPTLDQIRKTYGDKVRIVWRDVPLPFHPRAEPAAELARSARAQKGDAGFWAVHDALFASQPALEDADLEKIAVDTKLDSAKAMTAVRTKAYAAGLAADVSFADDFEVQGTPHFFVNGHRIVGAQSFEKFKPLIDDEIARAEALLKSGTAKTALYDALIKDGKAAQEPEKKAVAAIPASAPFRGTANAKIVIQEFGDFQCPFCGRADPLMDDLLQAFPGKLKIVWRDHPLPFHPDAPLASEAAREAFKQKGSEGWSKMAKLMWSHQQQLKRPDLDGYAHEVGLDMTKFADALDQHTHKAVIDSESKVANDADASGTPAFWIGPYFVSGVQPIEKFKKIVTLALALPADKATPALPVAKAAPAPTTPPTYPSAPPVAAPPPGKLIVQDTLVGSGREVKSGDKVKVHYIGKLTNGTEFDASRNRGNTPFQFKVGVGQVIKGWDQGLIGMKIGGKRKLTIPPDLAYGDRGAGATIPPKSTLVFDIELMDIE